MMNAASRLLALLVVLLLGAPAALRNAGLPERPLVGRVAEETARPALTLRGWLDGSFQRAAEIRASQAFALRTWLVRLNVELAFRLWNRAKANGVLVGPGLWLNGRSHVAAWNGADWAGEEPIRRRLGALARLDASLRSRGGAALLVVLPSKATVRPDLLPPGTPPPAGPRNRDAYVRLAPEAGAPVLDLTPRFLEHGRSSPHPLFSPYGIHWTELGAVLGMQDVLSRLGERTGRRLARVEITGVDVTDRIAPVDRDVADGMNLLFPLPPVRLAYPRVGVDAAGAWRPRALVVADSNFWNVFDLPLAGAAFSSLRFWFYANDLHERGQAIRFPKGDAEAALRRHGRRRAADARGGRRRATVRPRRRGRPPPRRRGLPPRGSEARRRRARVRGRPPRPPRGGEPARSRPRTACVGGPRAGPRTGEHRAPPRPRLLPRPGAPGRRAPPRGPRRARPPAARSARLGPLLREGSRPPPLREDVLMARLEVLAELWEFLRYRKKYWLAPVVFLVVLLGFLLALAEKSVLAPFLYTLF